MDTRSDSSAKSPFPSRAQMTRARLAAEAEASIEKARSTTHDAPRSAESAALLNAEGSAPLEAERATPKDVQSTMQHTSENAERLASGTAAGVNDEGIAGLNSENAAEFNNESTAPLGGAGAVPRTSWGAALGGRGAVSATSWDAVLLGDASSAAPGKSSSSGGGRGLGMSPFAPVHKRIAPAGAEDAALLNAEGIAPLHAEGVAVLDVEGTAPVGAEGAASLDSEGSAPLEAERATPQNVQSTTQHTSENVAELDSRIAAGCTSESTERLNSESTAGLTSDHSAGFNNEGTAPPWKSRKDESLSGESTPALHTRSAPHRRSTPIEGFMPIDSGMRVSALSVLLFSALTIAAWALPGAAWSFSPVIVVAGLALALGWNALTGMELPVPTIGVLALSALFVPLMVAYTHNLGSVVPVAGVASSLLIAATVMSLPAPRDRSREERAGDPPQGNPPQGRGTRPARSVAPPASTIHEDDNLRTPRRTTSRESSMPNYLVLSHAIAAQALIMSGTAWVALDALNQWAIIIPIAAIIIAAVVWGDQIGSSYRSQSLGALGTGVFAGIIAASAFWGVGMMTSITPIVLPGVTHIFGRLAAVLLLGVIAGLSVALSVIVLDGLLGDHIMRRPPLGALARGAAKFLIAATPIYAIVRIGGI